MNVDKSKYDLISDPTGKKSQEFFHNLENLDYRDQSLYFTQLSIDQKFNTIQQLQENRNYNHLRDVFIYLFKNDISLYQSKELQELGNYIFDTDKRVQFDRIRLLRTILTYINSRFENNDSNQNIPIITFSEKNIEDLNTMFLHLCETPFLSYISSLTIKTLEEQYKDRFDTKRIRANYGNYKVQGNNLTITGHKFGTQSRVSSDFVSFGRQQKSQGLTMYSKEEEYNYDENFIINNDSYRLYDNIFDIYIESKYPKQIGSNIDKREEKKSEENLPNNFNLSKYSEKFLQNIIFYLLDNLVENTRRIKYVFIQIFGEKKGNKIYQGLNSIIRSIEDQKNPHSALSYLLGKRYLSNQESERKNRILIKFTDILVGSDITQIEDTRKIRMLSGYQEIVASPNIDIYRNESPETLGLLLENIHEPQFLSILSEDIGFDITDLSLQIQVHLVRYLWKTDQEKYEEFKQIIHRLKDKKGFLNTFLICSKDSSLGDLLIALTLVKNGDDVLSRLGNLFQKMDIICSELSIVFKNMGLPDYEYECIIKAIIDFSTHGVNQSLKFNSIEDINRSLESFQDETIGLFSVLSKMSIDEIRKLDMNEILNFNYNTYSIHDITSNMKLKENILSLIISNFSSLDDIEAFKGILNSNNSNFIFHTLEVDGEVIYIICSEKISRENTDIIYLDWLARSKNLGFFNIRLTENFLQNQFNFGTLKDLNFEAIGEPHILTPYLFIERFGFVGSGTSDVPESENYGKSGKYVFLIKNRETKNNFGINDPSTPFLENHSVYLPQDNSKLLSQLNEKKRLGQVLTKLDKGNNNGPNCHYTCGYKKLED